MVSMNMTLKNATDYVRERRRFINPNPGFLRELGEEEVSVIMRVCLWPFSENGTFKAPDIFFTFACPAHPSTAFAG